MKIQHFSHDHPLVFNKKPINEDDENAYCSGCGEVASGPRFSCVTCWFHLDKNCAEAPYEINHPFHRNHNLNLLASSPYVTGLCFCDFCGKYCKKFVYHCSCRLDLHIKCALFSLNMAKNNIGGQLQCIAQKTPSISTKNHSAELKGAKCLACRKPLLDSTYLSFDSRFYLHKKCIELPLEINHCCHRRHSVILQFNNGRLPCQICQETQHRGFVYCCSICKFVIDIECESLPPVIEATASHEHLFIRFFLRQSSFTCDACGIPGNSVSYICSSCDLIVHKRCTSLPGIIKSFWHRHPIFHKYFLVDNECGTPECVICHKVVNIKCGSYHCSDCKVILHVNCALQCDIWYYKIESIKAYYENARLVANTMDPSFDVIQWFRHGENVINTEIKHFSHQHNLVLDDELKGYTCCDGCCELIATSFYRCSQCDFFLHKSCAELPRKKEIWRHFHQLPLNLVQRFFFICAFCDFECSGFAYHCEIYSCGTYCCIRCAKISQAHISQAHKHLLQFYLKYNGQCDACGGITTSPVYRCKGCDFNMHYQCNILPQIAQHKCDEHFLTLRYHEDNNYVEYLYCDICEEKRDPNHWFYYCAICDTSVHFQCVLGDYPFIKHGTKYFIDSLHQHPLVFVQRDRNHPKCFECSKPCLDLALACAKTICNYIIHWTCIPYFLKLYGGQKLFS